MIRTFLFDMGNVLVHFCHDRMCSQIGELCGMSAAEIHQLLIESNLQFQFERGQISEEGFHAELEARIGKTLDRNELYRAGSDIFQLNTTMIPVLQALKQAGCRLVLLSNTSEPHVRFVRETYDILNHFDDFVLSYEVGAIKPDAAIYEAALKKIGCAPAHCFYTDDIEEYVLAGRRFGLRAERFTDTSGLITQLKHLGFDLSDIVDTV